MKISKARVAKLASWRFTWFIFLAVFMQAYIVYGPSDKAVERLEYQVFDNSGVKLHGQLCLQEIPTYWICKEILCQYPHLLRTGCFI